jgi:hypothetical protein
MRLARSLWLLPLLLGAPPAVGAEVDAVQGEHRIIDVQGQVGVKRDGWKSDTYVPAAQGLRLRPGDLLKVEGDSRVTVVCGDATRSILTQSSPVPCKGEGQERKLGVARTATEQVPLILSPRATRLLLAPSVLRWSAVPGAKGYSLVLRDAASLEVHWRSPSVGTTQLDYPPPPKAPALVPGHAYLLEVTADKPGRPSSDSTTFVLLAPELARPLQEREARLEELGLSQETTDFLVASLYARNGLQAEALERLERLPASARVAAVERLWCTLLLSSGLPRLAREHADRAHTLATESKDVAGRLEAEELLGLIHKTLGAHDEWPRWLRSALEGYRELGDSQKVAALQKQLEGK